MFSDLDVQRFWDKVQIGAPDECWEWKGGRAREGYGHTRRIAGKSYRANRLALAFATESVPDGMSALHSCDNPPCCNPNHLRWGTPAENLADARDRGRIKRWHGERAGDKNPNVKLRPCDVRAIRMLSRSTSTKIAALFGVGRETVRDIRKGVTWTSLP
jgi:hypothetical protein